MPINVDGPGSRTAKLTRRGRHLHQRGTTSMTTPVTNTQADTDEWLSIDEVLAELKDVPRSTFTRWRATGRGPRSRRLPNGRILIRRSALNEWLESLPE
jgi:hypothetical protein